MGGTLKTLSNKTARRFVFVCLMLTAVMFAGVWAMNEYLGKNAAEKEVEYRMALAGRLTEAGLTEEQTADIITAPMTEAEISAGEELLNGYGYHRDSIAGGEYAKYPHYPADLLAGAGILLCLSAGLFCLNRVFGDIRRLTEQLEHDRKIVFSEEHDIGLLGEAAASLKEKSDHLLERLVAEKRYLADHLSDFSHQIKTPFTGLKLNNEILLSGPMGFEEQLGYLKRDKKCLDNISLLLEASLKLVRLDAGTVEYDMKPTDISLPVSEAAAKLAAISAENNAEIVNEVTAGTELVCDRLWLCEAVTNLVKNAAEHTHGGTVRIYAESDPMQVRIFIEDNGCGISEDELPNVFRRFWSKSRAVNSNSVGIGMSIARRVVEDMGGRIYIDSEKGKGTKIKLEFLRAVT
ncbi:HAMP domain-containing sensor histidine kinase [Ruminococcus sp.]|uniref:sensor histidine kinase n=1 Tax=Ruminococcus sp. TaxID=41978 RepID=UPI0025D39983|nr:HAMP domain-containing sensor histidine kinase [Ruminococcus sp.]MBQ8966285.1 HAMP domain-containing histidine kinase [Ruminococcus sp.]